MFYLPSILLASCDVCNGDVVLLFVSIFETVRVSDVTKRTAKFAFFFPETEQSSLIYSYLRNCAMEPTFLVNHCLGCDETAQAEQPSGADSIDISH